MYGIDKYRDCTYSAKYIYEVEVQDCLPKLVYSEGMRESVVVPIVLSILGTCTTLYGLYYKTYERLLLLIM